MKNEIEIYGYGDKGMGTQSVPTGQGDMASVLTSIKVARTGRGGYEAYLNFNDTYGGGGTLTRRLSRDLFVADFETFIENLCQATSTSYFKANPSEVMKKRGIREFFGYAEKKMPTEEELLALYKKAEWQEAQWNFDAAEALYGELEGLGYVPAILKMGYGHIHGCITYQDFYEAVDCYRRAARLGSAEGCHGVARCYSDWDVMDKDPVMAAKWDRKGAKMGHAGCQYHLAEALFYGEGVKKNVAEAIDWYRKAAEQGNADALCRLGECYEDGTGVVEDKKEAVKLYRKAARKGCLWAMFRIGWAYNSGSGVVEDHAEAVKWYRKAAGPTPRCIPLAQYNLGVCYENGDGVEKDDAEAVKWFTHAAGHGQKYAQFALGRRYQSGTGVEKNLVKAARFFRKAAVQGDEEAQYELGLCYEKGLGLRQNLESAEKWYRKAAKRGSEDAVAALKRF